ncbi:MAG: DNA polymerase I [Planctomycetota bacterium]
MARTFLLDGTALAYRAHFAFTSRGGGLTTSSGHPTSATYGFTLTLRALLEKEKPDRIALALDGPREQLERTRLYPDYKATREKAPDELLLQFEDVRRVVLGHGIRVLEIPGHEADDVIGTLATLCRDAGDEVYIVSGDKDFMQLVDGEQLRLYDVMRRGTQEPRIVDPAGVVEKFGVPPELIIDLFALMGDSSDNVPGIKGVGAKTAARLLNDYGSLDAVLDHAAEVKQPRLRQNLMEGRAMAELSRDLVRIRTDLDLGLEAADLSPAEPDRKSLLALFQELEFRGFADEIAQDLDADSEDSAERDYRIVESLEECHALARRLRARKAFALDTGTASPDVDEARLVGLSFSDREGRAWYVPLEGPDLPEGHDAGSWLAALGPVLEDPSLAKSGQDLKRDIRVLRRHGIELGGVRFDTMLASYCAAADVRRHDLGTLGMHFLGLHKTKASDVVGSGKKQVSMDLVGIQHAGAFACEDADLIRRLEQPLAAELGAFGVTSLFEDLEMPLLSVLADMEDRGIRLDTGYLAGLSGEMQERIAELADRIYAAAGEHFNINSAQQLGSILFEKLELHKKLGLRPPRRTATGQWSTDAAVLETLSGHEIGAMLLEYRRLTKLLGTYVDSLPALVRADGRIHTTFRQAVAATGRLSSDNPNLQNIPIRTEDGRRIRRAFIPGEPDWVLISADYSQVELRLLAHMSEDENLIAGFADGQDVHRRTASIVFDVAPELVSSELRSQAKVINYGLVYGMGANRLAQETGMKPREAKKFIEAYFRAMPKVKAWLDATVTEARQSGEVRTLLGRRRPLPQLDAQVPRLRAAAENIAVNSPLQGSAADVIKRAMIDLHRRIRAEGLEGRMLLQVHDELVVECPQREQEKMENLVRDSMEHAVELRVPLEVDVGTGKSWLEAHS